jgi:hypothetical protein
MLFIPNKKLVIEIAFGIIVLPLVIPAFGIFSFSQKI